LPATDDCDLSNYCTCTIDT